MYTLTPTLINKPLLRSGLVLVSLTALLCLNACGSNASTTSEEQSSKARALTLGESTPDFTLKGFSGENIRLNELRGNIVVITFWASWSGTSVKLINDFENLYHKYKDDNLKVISISINPDRSSNILEKLQGEHYQLFDSQTLVSRAYQVESVPSIFVLDSSGKLILKLEGYDPRYRDLVVNKVESLILN